MRDLWKGYNEALIESAIIGNISGAKRVEFVNRPSRKEFDYDVLFVVTLHRNLLSSMIRGWLTLKTGETPAKYERDEIDTRRIRRACRRLEEAGYLRQVWTSYAAQFCWDATDEGKAALIHGLKKARAMRREATFGVHG